MQAKVVKRDQEEKHAADRHQRRAIDALRSEIKHLDPPVRVADTWEDVRPRVEKSKEYRALDTDELRRSAFDKVIKRLKEKEEDREKDRRSRRDERDQRNGHKDDRRARASRTPEIDAYEADRRKAMAARERQYNKNRSAGLSPPPESDRYRDRERDRDRRRDDRHGRLDRSPPPRYDRERERRPPREDDERERLYRSRGDPRGGRDELNYGEETRSAAGSERRRRRRESDGESVDSGRRSNKRHRRTKSPEAVKAEPALPPPEPTGVHSGSEEGEIEEDDE